MVEFGIGQPVPRKEDLRLLTGGGRYVPDIALPNMAFAAMLRSPHAHARIEAIDTPLRVGGQWIDVQLRDEPLELLAQPTTSLAQN